MILKGFRFILIYTLFIASVVFLLCQAGHATEVFVEGGAGLTRGLRTADDGVWRQEGLGSTTNWDDLAIRAGVGITLNPSWSVGTNYIRLGQVKIDSQFVGDAEYDAINHVCLSSCESAPYGHVTGTMQGGEVVVTYHPKLWAVSPILRGGVAVLDHTVLLRYDHNPYVYRFHGVVVASVVGAGTCYQSWACVDISYYRGLADTQAPVSTGAVVSMVSLKYTF